jgi:hypothetical protein
MHRAGIFTGKNDKGFSVDSEEQLKRYIKTYPATELKPYAEPVSSDQMQEGRVYFSLMFADPDMLVPVLYPLIYLGHLDSDDPSLRVFQNFDSFIDGVRYSTHTDEQTEFFEVYGPEGGNHIFDYGHALEGLMRCALNRRDIVDLDRRIVRVAEQKSDGPKR